MTTGILETENCTPQPQFIGVDLLSNYIGSALVQRKCLLCYLPILSLHSTMTIRVKINRGRKEELLTFLLGNSILFSAFLKKLLLFFILWELGFLLQRILGFILQMFPGDHIITNLGNKYQIEIHLCLAYTYQTLRVSSHKPSWVTEQK